VSRRLKLKVEGVVFAILHKAQQSSFVFFLFSYLYAWPRPANRTGTTVSLAAASSRLGGQPGRELGALPAKPPGASRAREGWVSQPD